ncbi:antiterminator Q family protein [Providencia huaxiensis]|uniref:Antitermination protein n=1 Tax=Providencia huaxiensis TaxID=2027290 RepID=A0A8I2ALV0_9GAMM|nr:antiterminator Q family protein [Providencia huaxiensis]MBQ0266756.1 antitermination protein [Providencia huaxiensis]
MRDNDIHELVSKWGAWAAADHSDVDWPSIAAGFKGILPIVGSHYDQCNDDDGILIDTCVAKLKQYCYEEYEIVVLHYIYRASLRNIAKYKKCSDGTIRKKMQTALGFINGIISIIK